MLVHYRGVPMKIRKQVWSRADGMCEKCGRPAVDLAHIEHRKMGGSRLLDTADNLLALCRECHNLMDGRP
jgi:5-methylcytosine-specific restriction endonuclease McrA